MSYALFLDDIRTPLSTKHVQLPLYDWVIVKSFKEFVKKISEKGLPYYITFDHDLGAEHYPKNHDEMSLNHKINYDNMKEKSGYHCAIWLTEYCMDKKLPLPKFQVHSMNPAGKQNIIQLLNRFKEIQEEQNGSKS